MKSEFIHLHNHSDNSLLDGAQNVPSVLETITDLGMDSVALTEHGNLFGAVSFYKKAKDKNIKPIIGCEVYVAKGSRFQKDRSSGMGQYNHLVLIAQNYQGYKNLMKIVTHGYLEGFYYKPRVDTEILQKYNEGIICLSACLKGILPETLIYNGLEAGKKVAEEYSSIFPGRYYIELQNHGIPEELQNIQLATKLAKEMNLPIIATNDAHYAKKEHYKAHDVHICIGTGKHLSDKNRLKYPGNEFYFKSQDEMFSLFKQFPEALENTRALTDSVDLEIPMEDYHLPWYSIPGDKKSKDVDEYLKTLCSTGLKNKYENKPATKHLLPPIPSTFLGEQTHSIAHQSTARTLSFSSPAFQHRLLVFLSATHHYQDQLAKPLKGDSSHKTVLPKKINHCMRFSR